MYELDGLVLLLGVGHGNNTSLHLAEHRAPEFVPTRVESSPLLVDGLRQWVSYECLDEDESDFVVVGEAFAATGGQTSGPVGVATCHLMRARDVVDFAAEWMRKHRPVP